MPNAAHKNARITALYGGTFDPPHYGHLYPLLDTVNALNLSHVELLPAHIPVFKASATNIKHRLAMTQLLADLDPRLSVNTTELERKQASYTIDTLAELKQKAPHQNLIFIIGSDSLASLHKWHNWRALFDYCHIIVMLRPNADKESNNQKGLDERTPLHQDKNTSRSNSLSSKIDNLASLLYDFHTARLLFDDLVYSKMDVSNYTYLLSKLAPADGAMQNSINQGCMSDAFTDIIATSASGKLWLVKNKQIAVSSSFLREQFKQGNNVDKWVPKSIIKYINQHHLYQINK